MNWDRVEGEWKQRRGKAVQRWGKLMNDNLAAIAGKHEQLVGTLQEKYGIAKEEAKRQIEKLKKQIVQLKRKNRTLMKARTLPKTTEKKKKEKANGAPSPRVMKTKKGKCIVIAASQTITQFVHNRKYHMKLFFTHSHLSKQFENILKVTVTGAVIATILLFGGCKKDDIVAVGPTPVVIPLQTTVQETVNLRSDAGFVILAGSLVSNVPTSAITGDIGLSPSARSFITGFGLAEVTGTIYAADDISPAGVPAMLTEAKGDLTIAYNDAAGRTATDIVLLSGNIGGLTLTPGLYKSSGSLEISSGDLTFDAKGNANAVFIIQIASTLNTTSGRQVILSGGAKAANIFWQVGTSATLGTTSVFKGTIMADQSISLNTGATIEGRLLARIAGITLAGNTVVKPI